MKHTHEPPPDLVLDATLLPILESPEENRWVWKDFRKLLVNPFSFEMVCDLCEGLEHHIHLKKTLTEKGPINCIDPFPSLVKISFSIRNVKGRKIEYALGQCKNCKTIYWDEMGEI